MGTIYSVHFLGYGSVQIIAEREGFGFTSRRLPPPRVSHRLAVLLVRTLAKHRSAVLIPPATKAVWSLLSARQKITLSGDYIPRDPYPI